MTSKDNARSIVDQMMENDHFSRWLGIEILYVEEGRCSLQMTVRKEMLNGFGIAHGGISYALADSALAFASNSHGRKAVSIETSISHLKPLKEVQKINAEAELENLGNKIATYHVKVNSDNNQLIASFKGTVYRTADEWNT